VPLYSLEALVGFLCLALRQEASGGLYVVCGAAFEVLAFILQAVR